MGTETNRRYRLAKTKEERDEDNYNKYIYRGLA